VQSISKRWCGVDKLTHIHTQDTRTQHRKNEEMSVVDVRQAEIRGTRAGGFSASCGISPFTDPPLIAVSSHYFTFAPKERLNGSLQCFRCHRLLSRRYCSLCPRAANAKIEKKKQLVHTNHEKPTKRRKGKVGGERKQQKCREGVRWCSQRYTAADVVGTSHTKVGGEGKNEGEKKRQDKEN
jgi:hypothetical protein